MSRRAVPSPTSPSDPPLITGTPRRPAFIRRRGLFVLLLLVYVALLLALLALSLRQHGHLVNA